MVLYIPYFGGISCQTGDPLEFIAQSDALILDNTRAVKVFRYCSRMNHSIVCSGF